MAIADCIREKARAGEISEADAERLVEMVDEFERDLRKRGHASARQEAVRRTTEALEHENTAKKRRRLAQALAQSDIENRFEQFADSPEDVALSHFSFDPTQRVVGPNVDQVQNQIRGLAHARMIPFLEKFRSRAAGVPELAEALGVSREKRLSNLRAVVRELKGENSGNAAAREVAKGLAEAFEYLRKEFNAAGGSIPRRQDWGMPQSHHRRIIAETDKDEWIEFVSQRLDRDKMIDLDTGQPFTDTRLREVLDGVYDDIVSGGLGDVRPGGAHGVNVALKRQHHRFLVFQDADSWLEYHDRFGETDLFNAMMGHIDMMSRDTAMMRVLGPNPDSSVEFIKRVARDRMQARGIEKDISDKIDGHYRLVSGRANSIQNPFWAAMSEGNRNILSSAILGSAFFTAFADRAFIATRANLLGIPAGRTMRRHLELFNPANHEDRKLALQLGFSNEVWLSRVLYQQRYAGEVMGPEWTRRLSDTVLRMSFLSPWTQAGRDSFAIETLGWITQHAGRQFNELPDLMRQTFQRYGIEPDDWEVIRNTPQWQAPNGAQFIRPQDIIGQVENVGARFSRHQEVGTKLYQLLDTEREFAVPTATVRTRAITTAGGRPRGSLARELSSNLFHIKSFPLNLVNTHLRFAAMSNISRAQKAKYWAHLIIGTTMIGGFSEQLRQISQGRNPMNMDPSTETGRAFWQKAAMRGGGLGIFGDFLFSETNRYGGGFLETLAGPVFGSQGTAALTLYGDIQQLIREGDAGTIGRDAMRFAELMTPGHSLWYAQLAMERLIFDEIQKMIDPGYARSFRAIQSRARSEYEQEYFAPPGRGLPERPPDLEEALGR